MPLPLQDDAELFVYPAEVVGNGFAAWLNAMRQSNPT